MKTAKLSIAEVADKLRGQEDLPLWAVASSSTIQAIGKGKKELFGSRGRLLSRLFSFTGVGWIGLQALRLIAFCIVTVWWVKSLGVARTRVTPVELFIGFGAGPEEQMFACFQAEGSRLVAHLDQTRPASLAMIARPTLLNLWRYAWKVAGVAVAGLQNARNPVVHDHVLDWITAISIRIGSYIFFKAWADKLPKETRRIVFISPDIPAFAVIDAKKQNPGFSVEFWQHGLLRRSVLLPKFDKVLALNRPEAEHIRFKSESSQVIITQVNLKNESLGEKSNLLFASIYDFEGFDKLDHVEVLKEAFAWAAGQGLQIVVRLHPCEKEGFWEHHFPEVRVDRAGGQLEECLSRLAPKLVMSWFSTALIDALKLGAIPVLIIQGSEEHLEDIVFPLEKIAVRWPEEKSLLDHMLNEPEIYNKHVLSRQKEAFCEKG